MIYRVDDYNCGDPMPSPAVGADERASDLRGVCLRQGTVHFNLPQEGTWFVVQVEDDGQVE